MSQEEMQKPLPERMAGAVEGAERALDLLVRVRVEMPQAHDELLKLIDDPSITPTLSTYMKILVTLGQYALDGKCLVAEMEAETQAREESQRFLDSGGWMN